MTVLQLLDRDLLLSSVLQWSRDPKAAEARVRSILRARFRLSPSRYEVRALTRRLLHLYTKLRYSRALMTSPDMEMKTTFPASDKPWELSTSGPREGSLQHSSL